MVSGNAENKKLQDLLPGIINQLAPQPGEPRQIADSYSGAPCGGRPTTTSLPDLVDNFEDVTVEICTGV